MSPAGAPSAPVRSLFSLPSPAGPWFLEVRALNLFTSGRCLSWVLLRGTCVSPGQAGVGAGQGASWGSAHEEEASARGGFVPQEEVAGLLRGLESVCLELTAINHTCHIPSMPVSVDMLLISVLKIVGPREKPDKQNFTSETTSHKRPESALLPAWASVILQRRVCPFGAHRWRMAVAPGIEGAQVAGGCAPADTAP